MEKKNFIILMILIFLLVLSIVLMAISLMLRERVFGQVSGYIAIASIVITLVGVILIIRDNHRHKDE